MREYAASTRRKQDCVAAEPVPGDAFALLRRWMTTDRTARQEEAAGFIHQALSAYDVQAVDTLIGDITPPEQLMKTQTDRKIAEEERKA